MHDPKISVVVPIYKVEKELEACVQSIRGQTLEDIEIILVDDGSPDACPEMCDAFAAQDDRITVLHKPNGGLSDARNAGLKMAKGTFVLFVDADDFLSPDACEQMLKGVTDDVDLVAGNFTDWNGTESSASRRDPFADGEIADNEDFMLRSLKNGCFFVQSWCYMYRREFMIEKNLYFKTGWLYEDLEMAPRLFLSASKIMIRDYPFYNHVVFRENSITSSSVSPKKIHDVIGVLKEWRELVPTIKNRELRFWLGHELTFSYICACTVRDMTGWWIRGLHLPFALRHCVKKGDLATVLHYEKHSIKVRFFGQSSIPYSELRRITRHEGIYVEE